MPHCDLLPVGPGNYTCQVCGRKFVSKSSLDELMYLTECPGAAPAKEAIGTGVAELEITTRNLIYHVCPRAANDVWRWNLDLLRKHWPIFNGRRILTISTGAGLDSPRDVREYAPDFDEVIEVENIVIMAETPAFLPALARLENTSQNEAFFYAHAKGITRKGRPEWPQIKLWVEKSYEYNLGNVEAVTESLRTHACTGCFKRNGHHFGPQYHPWHYSGTFFWARHWDVFSRPDWQQCQPVKHGVEAWLSRFIEARAAGCLAWNNAGGLYELSWWNEHGLPQELESWLAAA